MNTEKFKVLIVARTDQMGRPSPFVSEQVDGLIKLGANIEYFLIKQKGLMGYIRTYSSFRKKISDEKYSLVHAHYGLSGLFAAFQRKLPLVITFHGSDINIFWVRILSSFASYFAKGNIFVSKKLLISRNIKNYIIPCGVDTTNFYEVDKREARNYFGFSEEDIIIVFSSDFNNRVKNYPLAKAAIELLKNERIKLVELKGLSRLEVNLLLNAGDIALLTSFSEGSPQFIKEAMACSCPVVSTDVGDVKWMFKGLEGYFISEPEPEMVASKIKKAIKFVHEKGKTDGRKRILDLGLDTKNISLKVFNLYKLIFLKEKIKKLKEEANVLEINKLRKIILMKKQLNILFVSSGNNIFKLSQIVKNQGNSLEDVGIQVDYYPIFGKGIIGYLRHIKEFHHFIKESNYDLIHSHYSFSSFFVSLAVPRIPVVTSLMGSDTRMNYFWKIVIKLNIKFFWDAIIVKSDEMKKRINIKALVIPNGVDLNEFSIRNKIEAQEKVGFDKEKKHLLFLSDPSRYEKNYKLAEEAHKKLNDPNVELHVIFNKHHNDVVNFLYASDLVLMTSFWEGSPNVIKEAMACNIPIVSTRVGDVENLLNGLEGCYMTTYESEDVAEKIRMALSFSSEKINTDGRERIVKLGLESFAVANKLKALYYQVYNEKVIRFIN